MPLSKIQLSSSTGRRNLVINGAMQVAQRSSSAVTATGDGNYLSVDRFKWRSYGGAGRASFEQSTDTPTSEYRYSLKATVTTVNSGLDQYDSSIGHIIEGYNRLPLGWGTSNPSPCTISFWVKTSIAGVYSVSMRAGSGARSQVQETPSLTANTWTKVILTFVGDTDGEWLTSNYAEAGTGIIVEFNLGRSNAKNTTTLGSWIGSNRVASDNQVRWIENNGATFFLTGVQVEKGSTATEFEHLPFGEELSLCERYFQTIHGGVCQPASSGTAETTFPRRPMRAAPTASVSAALKIEDPSVTVYTQSSATIIINNATARAEKLGINNLSGLNTQRPYFLQTSGGHIELEAEL